MALPVPYAVSDRDFIDAGGCGLYGSGLTAPNACKQVEGDISPNGWCRIWSNVG
jgi:hypothetical protein